MIVKLTTGVAGADFNYGAGEVRDLPDAEATRLIQAGFAEPVKKAKPIRTASAAPADLETTEAK